MSDGFLKNLLDFFYIDVFLSNTSQEHVRIDVKPKSFLSREVIIFCGPDCRTQVHRWSPPHKKNKQTTVGQSNFKFQETEIEFLWSKMDVLFLGIDPQSFT